MKLMRTNVAANTARVEENREFNLRKSWSKCLRMTHSLKRRKLPPRQLHHQLPILNHGLAGSVLGGLNNESNFIFVLNYAHFHSERMFNVVIQAVEVAPIGRNVHNDSARGTQPKGFVF